MSRTQLVAWLDDAYAMETGLVSILQRHAGSYESALPETAARLRQHISETRQHADRLEQCLRTLGSTPSTAKSTASALMGTVEGMSTAMFNDELVKNTLADYGAEQFEVACYTALVSAAMKLGYPDVAHLCEQNLKEDEAMAAWLRQQLPAAVNVMLTRNP
jgi:ferritin-like metal-binding protein YciE